MTEKEEKAKKEEPVEEGKKKRVEGWGLEHFQKMNDRDLEWWSRLGEPTDPNAKIRELVQVVIVRIKRFFVLFFVILLFDDFF